MEFDTEAPKEQIDAARREKREKKNKKAKEKEEQGEGESDSEGMSAKKCYNTWEPFYKVTPEMRTS